MASFTSAANACLSYASGQQDYHRQMLSHLYSTDRGDPKVSFCFSNRLTTVWTSFGTDPDFLLVDPLCLAGDSLVEIYCNSITRFSQSLRPRHVRHAWICRVVRR